MRFLSLMLCILLLPSGFLQIAHAQNLTLVQRITAFTNDGLGDGQDRWRTFSALHALEFKTEGANAEQSYSVQLRAEMIAPSNLERATLRPDRRYAGLLEFGINRNWANETRHHFFGGGLTFVGPSTGIGDVHRIFHQAIGAPVPGVLDTQLEDRVYPLLQAGVSRRWYSDRHSVIARMEAQAGIETFVRLGADLVWGSQAARFHKLRDAVTGQLLTTGQRDTPRDGLSLLAGLDIAYILDSKLFPKLGVAPTSTRGRVRLGLSHQAKGRSAFYGLTYLSKEFEAQAEGQVLGTFAFNWRF